jgi:hypothetical protein
MKEQIPHNKGRFVKGYTPHSKGRKASEWMSAEGMERCAKTQFKKGIVSEASLNTCFKKGNVPNNAKPDMSLSDRRGNGRFERYIKISGKWRMYSHYVWEQATGQKMGARDVIRFVDGNHFNFDIGNLKKITRSEIINDLWTDDEIELLKKVYLNTQTSDLVKIFNRSIAAIRQKANHLGMVKPDDNLPDVSVAICLHRKKDGIRDAILENKSLIEFKRAQILLSRKIKQANGGEKTKKDVV